MNDKRNPVFCSNAFVLASLFLFAGGHPILGGIAVVLAFAQGYQESRP